MPLKKKPINEETEKRIKEERFWEKIDIISLNYWNTGLFKYPKWLKQKKNITEHFEWKDFE